MKVIEQITFIVETKTNSVLRVKNKDLACGDYI